MCLLWFLVTFFFLWLLRHIPEKVNLNLIIFYMLEILIIKETSSFCKSESYPLVYLLCLDFLNWGFVSLFIEDTDIYIHIF